MRIKESTLSCFRKTEFCLEVRVLSHVADVTRYQIVLDSVLSTTIFLVNKSFFKYLDFFLCGVIQMGT